MKVIDKCIDTPDAEEFLDLTMIKDDLVFAKSCFEALVTRPRAVTFSPFARHLDLQQFNDWCTFAAAGLHYRRCFKSGVRSRIERKELEAALTHNRILLHDTLVDIVDKHFAHSVNEMEVGNVLVQIELHDDGRIEQKGVDAETLRTGPLNGPAYTLVIQMVSQILDSLVEPKLLNVQQRVTAYVAGLTDQQIMALPERKLDFITNPKWGARRVRSGK
jgi:hypothetical protein